MAATAYAWGITVAEVLTFVGYAPSAANANPGSTAIQSWIDAYSSIVDDAIYGVTGSYPDSTWATSYIATYYAARAAILGRCAAAWYVANQRTMSEYAQTLIDEYQSYLESLRTRPTHVLGDVGHSVSLTAGVQTADTTTSKMTRLKEKRWITEGGGFR